MKGAVMVRKYCIGVLALMAMVIIMVCMAQPVFADQEPVEIGNWTELKAFIDDVNSGSGAKLEQDAKLTADIVVPDSVGNDWVPLGKDKDHVYQGKFNGGSYKISGINVDRGNAYPDTWSEGEHVNNFTAFCSFLGEQGEIRNLTLDARIIDVNDVAGFVSQNRGLIYNCEFSGYLESNVYPNKDADGGLLIPEAPELGTHDGETGGFAAANMGNISSCQTLEGTKIVRGGMNAGGIVGQQSNGGNLFLCVNFAEISAKETKYPVMATYVGYIGGVCGLQETDPDKAVTAATRPVINTCVNYGSIACEQLCGGVCGGSRGGDITGCGNFGKVYVDHNWAGGIVAEFSTASVFPEGEESELSRCINKGEINPQKPDEKTGMYHGARVGGIVGTLEDKINGMTGETFHMKAHHLINYAPVTGECYVGGVAGEIANGETEDKGTLVYEMVNLGEVTGNNYVGGVAGDCPGILSDALNYGMVTMIPASDDEEEYELYYLAGGIASTVDSTGCLTTAVNAGVVQALNPDLTKNDDKNVFIGAVLGDAAAESQNRGNYYVAEASGFVSGPIGSWENYLKGMVKLSDAGGEAAKTSMPALFDGTMTRHAPSMWQTVENVVVGETTYYMVPQLDDILGLTLEEIQESGAQISYPVEMMYANVFIPSMTYTGKALKPQIEVRLGGMVLDPSEYTVKAPESYLNAGTYDIEVESNSDKYAGVAAGTFTINKAAQKIKSVKPLSKTIKAGKSYKLKATVTPAKGHGKVTYTKKSGNKKIKISSAGKVTVKKGLKKGTYKVKVTVKAAGNSNCKAASATKTLKIKVK